MAPCDWCSKSLFYQKHTAESRISPLRGFLSVTSASLFEQGLLPVSHARKPTSSKAKSKNRFFTHVAYGFCVLMCSKAPRKWKQKNKHPSYASWKGSLTCTELRWRQSIKSPDFNGFGCEAKSRWRNALWWRFSKIKCRSARDLERSDAN